MADKFLAEKFDDDIHLHGIRNFILSRKSRFQDISIVDSFSFGRMLVLDGYPQSAETDEKIYHECLVQPVMFLQPGAKKVLILGGGEGATLREVLKHRNVEKAVMVDIDEELVRICEEHLPEWSAGAFKDPRAELVFGDAFSWIDNCREKFDVVILDLTDPGESELSKRIFSREFMEKLKGIMSPSGMGAIQSGRTDPQKIHLFSGVFRTLLDVFPHARSYMDYIPSFLESWGFNLFSNQEINFDMEGIEKKSQELGLKFYDGETHQRIFSLPKHIRDKLQK